MTESTADRSLLRIQQVADRTGLTPRAIRYYEEVGLLAPASRSDGAYRLYDADDVERLCFIRGLRDDAGFSLADISRLLEDEATRARNLERFDSSRDSEGRRRVIQDAIRIVDRQVVTLRAKAARLETMVAEAEQRRARLEDLAATHEPEHVHGTSRGVGR